MTATKRKGLITDLAELRSRCNVDPATHCWIWPWARTKGTPTLWAFDHARGEKRCMPGTRAVWNLAHGEAPLPGRIIFRACCNSHCLNPAHLRDARTKAEIGLHIQRSGIRRGTHVEQRRANVRKAWAATGIKVTDPDVVRAIRAAPPSVTGKSLAETYRIDRRTVSLIRRGESHKGVV